MLPRIFVISLLLGIGTIGCKKKTETVIKTVVVTEEKIVPSTWDGICSHDGQPGVPASFELADIVNSLDTNFIQSGICGNGTTSTSPDTAPYCIFAVTGSVVLGDGTKLDPLYTFTIYNDSNCTTSSGDTSTYSITAVGNLGQGLGAPKNMSDVCKLSQSWSGKWIQMNRVVTSGWLYEGVMLWENPDASTTTCSLGFLSNLPLTYASPCLQCP